VLQGMRKSEGISFFFVQKTKQTTKQERDALKNLKIFLS